MGLYYVCTKFGAFLKNVMIDPFYYDIGTIGYQSTGILLLQACCRWFVKMQEHVVEFFDAANMLPRFAVTAKMWPHLRDVFPKVL